MNAKASILFSYSILIAAFLSNCTLVGDNDSSQQEVGNHQEGMVMENEDLAPDFVAKTDEGALFVLGIKRIGGLKDPGRDTHLEITAKVPITSISGRDWKFSGTGHGMLEETGTLGPNTYTTIREMKYEVKGSFMDCDIFLDEVMEIWGEGEICTTVPLAGTSCEPIPGGESDYLLLDTEVMIFDAYREDGGYWWTISEWERGGLHWMDSFSLEE